MRHCICRYSVTGISIASLAFVLLWVLNLPGQDIVIGSYSTSLHERTLSQTYNAALAARRIDGTVVEPGATFSFIRTIGPWSHDAGYEKAPVSYDGELVESWGGGVCQTSTTLYGAALHAGMDIVERHRHHWPARYAPPGMDAAVAYASVDLRFRNPLPWPVRISVEIRGDGLICRIMCAHRPAYTVRVKREIRSVTPPTEVVQVSPSENGYRLVNPGQSGVQVITYRSLSGTDSRWQIISDDCYPAMNRVVRVKQQM